MSFGFGNNNNNSTFGGFGSGGNSGFGSNNNTSANTGSLFGGGNTNNATSGGFGGFGSTNTSSPFGAKPATTFGATATTSSGGMFGGNTTTSGGFGSGFGQNNTSSGFGASNSGGLFGGNKPTTGGFGTGTSAGFGANNTTANPGSIFGGGTSGGFGSNANTTSSNPFASNTAGGGFGSNTNNATSSFGGFGSSNTATSNNGTAGTPFQAFSEKDGTSNQTSHYQSITFQQPYLQKSFEELRVEDYLQGRRFGNTNGQAGSFGTTTGFGGGLFGGGNNTTTNNTSSGGLFASSTNNTSGNTGFGGFGGNNTSTNTGGFGGNNSGGLFGSQNKPAGGSIFGGGQSSATTTGGFGSTAGSTGGLFGGGGFGANGQQQQQQQQQQQSGGLFGNNNQQQNKPAFGGFGSTNNNTTGGFGGTTSTAGGLFGSSTTQNPNPGGGLFGSANNQQQQSNPFGASTNTGGSLFGNNQNKPATGGLFGGGASTNTGGGLFGSNNTQQQSGGLFGNSTNTNSGGLFGNNNQSKPATGGLFGSSTTNTNTGGGLFGNNQQQQSGGGGLFGNTNTGSSLFGGNNQSKPAGGSLFGNTTSNTGGGLFGGLGQNTQQNQQSNTGGGLFGSLGQSNQNPQNSSLFGGSMGQSQATQQNQLHASLTSAPYGNDQLFSSLASSTPIGPLATPLSGAKPPQTKTPSLLSSTRLNSPIYTPRASTLNRTGTYGFSYSTYGTPGSAYSTSLTPQQSSLLKPTGSLGSALTSRLAKSMSMNNLRGDGTPREGESLLRPTPGSASSKYLQSGSMRKLIIDRSLRSDLFAPGDSQKQIEPAKGGVETESPGLKKKVSFDNAASSTAEPSASNALVRTEEPEEQESPTSLFGGSRTKGGPEMQQVNGTSLNTVPEDSEPTRPSSAPGIKKTAEKKSTSKNVELGPYWTKPSIKDLKNMSRGQLSKLGKFVVGRDGVGRIEFGPCDLTNTDLDDICGRICVFNVRSVTVYPEEATKPPRGKGLNVPSTIYLENSWPRSHGGRKAVQAKTGPAFEKHLARLKSTSGTTFKDYDVDTGVWTFTVEHFTTYGLDEEDDEYTEDMDTQQESSGLSDPPEEDDTIQSMDLGNGDMDDTFEFKNLKTRSLSSQPAPHLPGGFHDEDVGYSFEETARREEADGYTISGGLGEDEDEYPFAAPGGAVQAPSPGAVERYHSSMLLDEDENGTVDIAEETQIDPEPPLPGSFIAEEPPKGLRSILKPNVGMSAFASPEKLATESWEDQLQRTLSPKKRDRQALREQQQDLLRVHETRPAESPLKRSMLGQSMLDQSALGQSYLAQKSSKKSASGRNAMALDESDLTRSQAFRTSMDIMNSLWANEKTSKKTSGATRSLEKPYQKKLRLSASSDLDDVEASFHNCVKPSFANNGTLVFTVDGSARQVTQPLVTSIQPLVGEHKEVRFARWNAPRGLNNDVLTAQKECTAVEVVDKFPFAQTDMPTTVFQGIASRVNADEIFERSAWELADILFDTVITACGSLIEGMPAEDIVRYEPRLRKDAFGIFWADLLEPTVTSQLAYAHSAEEKALLYLTKNDIRAACDVLVKAKDFKLATMIAQLPAGDSSRQLMAKQIDSWLNREDWSEMSDAVRTLYSILAGQVCTVEGKNGPMENRVSTFCISKRFRLSWMQALALRVFYGGFSSLDDAVESYVKDLDSGKEKVQPLPWWVDNDGIDEDIEDTLLSLLRLKISKAKEEAMFDPRTVSGSPLNSRLAWQLATFLRAKGHARSLSDEKLDQLTVGFAAELEASNALVTAAWVLLHLTKVEERQKAVAELLFRQARNIGEPPSPENEQEEGNWFLLTSLLLIPQELLWAAKAQFAKAELKDTVLQAKYLLNADAADEAHDVLCTFIGPRAIIEEEYEPLEEVLAAFGDHRVTSWESGGRVFQDFLRLLKMPTNRKHRQEGRQLLERLLVGLEAMGSAEKGGMTLEEKVTVVEMERVVKEEIRDFNDQSTFGEIRTQEMDVDDAEGVKVGDVNSFARYQRAMGVVA